MSYKNSVLSYQVMISRGLPNAQAKEPPNSEKIELTRYSFGQCFRKFIDITFLHILRDTLYRNAFFMHCGIHFNNAVCTSHVCHSINADEIFLETLSLGTKRIFYSV
jgi:hypothetical protein